jgi:hypothetical protein
MPFFEIFTRYVDFLSSHFGIFFCMMKILQRQYKKYYLYVTFMY